MYAVIETGGKQYKVAVGDVVDVELLPVEPGEAVNIDRVLMLSNGDAIQVGQPLVEGANVLTRVVEHGRADKVIVFKYKNKTRYRRRLGHRQPFTRLAVEEITV